MFSKNTAAKLALMVIIGSALALPLFASAAGFVQPNIWPTGFWAPQGLVTCTGNYTSPGSLPTCQSLCDLIDTFITIIYFAMSIALFILAPIFCIVGGIMIAISGANPEMLGTGKKVLTGTVVGLALVLCSYLIVNTVITTLNITGIGGFGGASCSTTS